MSDNLHNAIRLHHALATKAADYTKKQHVFRLQTADQAEYLFQTSDSKELQSWVDTINLVCASFSAPPLEGGVGSQKRFQRPLLPSTKTKLMLVSGDSLLLHFDVFHDMFCNSAKRRMLLCCKVGSTVILKLCALRSFSPELIIVQSVESRYQPD